MRVLVIGPATVSGGAPVPDEIVWAAIDSIDDRHTLLEERVVRVDALWESVLVTAAPNAEARLTLVCPGWWSDERVARIRRAAGPEGGTVIRRRHQMYRPEVGCRLEIASEFVLCRTAGRPPAATPRSGAAADDAQTVLAGLDGGGPVLIDAPARLPGAAELAAALGRALRQRGRDVEVIDDATLCAASPDDPPARRRRGAIAYTVSASALLACAVLLAAGRWLPPPAEEHLPVALLAEGRVTVHIPAGWPVTRITDGTGSPRVQADSPVYPRAAILLTQSPADRDPARTAAVLKAALDRQPDGVFSDFRADDERAGRAVTSYVEVRGDREIGWVVFTDGPVRIAVGCQQPAGDGRPIQRQCDEAIRSARGRP